MAAQHGITRSQHETAEQHALIGWDYLAGYGSAHLWANLPSTPNWLQTTWIDNTGASPFTRQQRKHHLKLFTFVH